MTGVTPSSSGVSSSAQSGARSFDVADEAQVLQLLNFIRRGPFEQVQKNLYRDAVLDYTAERNTVVLSDVAHALNTVGATLLHQGTPLIPTTETPETTTAVNTHEPATAGTDQSNTPAAAASAAPSGFGTTRPQPVFAAAAPTPATDETTSPADESSTQTKPEPSITPTGTPVMQSTPAPPESATAPNLEQPAETSPDPAAGAAIASAAPAGTTQPATAPATAPAPDSQKPETDTPTEQPANPTDTPVPAATPTEPVSEFTDVTPPVPETASSNSQPSSESESEVPTQTLPSAPPKDPLTRVKEIKQHVNEQVGNPVNLIDANNTVGREYMNALLNAMKQINGGASDNIQFAMDRLEKAFEAVQASLQSGETVIGRPDPAANVIARVSPGSNPSNASNPSTTNPSITNSPQEQPAIKDSATTLHTSPPHQEPIAPTSDARTSSPRSQSSAIPTSRPTDAALSTKADQPATKSAPIASEPATSTSPAADVAAKPKSESNPVPITKIDQSDSPKPASNTPSPNLYDEGGPQASFTPPVPRPPAPPSPPTPEMATPDAPTPASSETSAATATDPINTSAVTPKTDGTTPQSLAAKLQAQSTARAEQTAARAAELKIEEAKTSADPLHSHEVSAGLQQLLSEWKLFKSSGLFGTGPSGYEHPLYQKLSALPMSTIIAGRFEGSTPEIKQSLTDYMNGWRYEQGVVHEMNETFEHYLRRVIKTILDKQQNNSPA